MSAFDFPTRFICAGFLLLTLISVNAQTGFNNLDDPCQSDKECGQNTVCWRYPVSPPCQLGTCQCQPKFFRTSRSKSDCFPRLPLMLNASCSNDELEQYPAGAHCYAGLVKCKVQYQQLFNSCALLPSAKSDYGAHCITDAQCNPEIGLFCNLVWQSCTCFSNYIWAGNVCEEAYYGMNCETNDNCQTGGAYSLGGPGNGGTCDELEHTCTCERGFQTVNFTQFYLDDTGESLEMVKNTWTICVVSQMNTIRLDVGDQCTVTAWSSATPISGQSYCKGGLACIECPEAQMQSNSNNNNTLATPSTGICRNGSIRRTPHQSNLAATAFLTIIFLVARMF